MTIQEANLAALFGFLRDDTLALCSLLERYVAYRGSLYQGHRILLGKQLIRAAALLDAPAAAEYRAGDVLLPDGRIAEGFLHRFAPEFARAFYDDGPTTDFTRETLVAASPNEWRSTMLPPPLNNRLRIPARPALDALFAERRFLFVSPYGYQYFDPHAGRAWPAASSRSFPRTIEGHRTVPLDSPVVVVQDKFDGANLAHFLYDAIPRVLHFTAHYSDLARSCRFLMGGEPGPYHALLLDWVCKRHGLARNQFVFPRDFAIWRLGERIAFFSDQVEAPAHPLLMAHKPTVGMVRDLLEPLTAPTDQPTRILVLRDSSPGTRLLNETELARAVGDRGYALIRMGEYDAKTQVDLLAHARHVVAVHGAGLTNLVFAQPGGSLVEIFNPAMGSDTYAFVAACIGMGYRFSIGEDRGGTFRGTVADVDEIVSLLDALDPTPLSKLRPAEAPRARPSTTEVPNSMLSDADLVQQFESLGENCEFGLVQRYVRAEPLGLFRFNFLHRAALIDMLDTELRDVDRPEDIEVRRANSAEDAELYVHNRRYKYNYHTFRHDADAEKVRTQQIRVISFLRDKLLADLRTAEKTFVRKGEYAIEQAVDLLHRLRRYGPATLLWVVPEDEANAAGTVRVLQPGLLQGFLDRFAPPTEAYDLSPLWLPMLRNAHAARAGGCPPGTVISAPVRREATNLLRRAYVFPQTGNFSVSAVSTVTEAGSDAPARVHPESPVIEHRLTTDTVAKTGALCGITLQHGMVPGAPYVVSMDVWVPAGAPLELVGAVFNGLPAMQVHNADLTRRGEWQRVWVAARAISPEARINPSLFAVGKEGARLYSTTWMLELGHTPSPYAPSRAGILQNLGPSPESFRQRTRG